MNLDVKKIGIILSNLATAFLHLSLLPQMGPDPIALNGFGYLGLLGAYFAPMDMLQKNHKMVWWGMFGYTVLTFVLWILLGDKNFVAGTSSAIGYYAKTAEIFLMAFLWADKKS
jgi:hypothetical protein